MFGDILFLNLIVLSIYSVGRAKNKVDPESGLEIFSIEMFELEKMILSFGYVQRETTLVKEKGKYTVNLILRMVTFCKDSDFVMTHSLLVGAIKTKLCQKMQYIHKRDEVVFLFPP